MCIQFIDQNGTCKLHFSMVSFSDIDMIVKSISDHDRD